MRVNSNQQSFGGGVAAGIYPYMLKSEMRDVAGFETQSDGSATQEVMIPTNFIATPQTAINSSITDAKTRYPLGNTLLNTAETLKSRFGSWVGAQKVKYLKISPLGKQVTNHVVAAASATDYHSFMVDTNTICVIWKTLVSAGKYQFYAMAGTFGAGGITWGAETSFACYQATTSNATWSACKQAAGKGIVYFADWANLNYLSAFAFTVAGTTVSAAGGIQQIVATAAPNVRACYAGADKSFAATNVATDLAYCCTTAALVITAGAGVRITTTACNANQPPWPIYISDDKILEVHNDAGSANVCVSICTIVTRTITHNAEATIAAAVSDVRAALVSTALACTYNPTGSSANIEVAIGATTVTLTALLVADLPFVGTQQIYPAQDSANNEIWWLTTTKVYKGKVSGGHVINNTAGSYEYMYDSADAAFIATTEQFAGVSGSIIAMKYNSATQFTVNMVSAIKPTVTINGVVAYTAGAKANGFLISLDTDVSALGSIDISVLNNAGNFAAMQLDYMLLTCS